MIRTLALAACAVLLTSPAMAAISTPSPDSDSTSSRPGLNTFIAEHPIILINGPGPNAVVPEPATWALLITGFGLVGAIVRRQRRGLTHKLD